MAASSRAVGLSGSRAGGRLPNFIRHAISNNLALVALRFDPEMKIGVPSANPSGAPRPTRTTGSPLSTALAMCFWRACEVIEPYGACPCVKKTGEPAEAKLVPDQKGEVGLERRILAELFAAISAVLDDRHRGNRARQDFPSRPLDRDLEGFHAVEPDTHGSGCARQAAGVHLRQIGVLVRGNIEQRRFAHMIAAAEDAAVAPGGHIAH